VFSLGRPTHPISTILSARLPPLPLLRLPLSRPGSHSRTSLHFLRELPDRLLADRFEKASDTSSFGRLLTCALSTAGSGAQGCPGVAYPLGRSNKVPIRHETTLRHMTPNPLAPTQTAARFRPRTQDNPQRKQRSSLLKVLASMNSGA
jgi:hypothetical protein